MKQPADRLTLMQTFIRIVEAGNLSAAAAQMNSTQPTVSRRLQTLERSLGLQLMQRSTHAMKLTEAGTRYYTHAKELIERWSEFESDLRGSVDEPQGLLRAVVPHAFGQHQLVGPMSEYLARYPRVSVEWLLHDTPPDFITQGIDCAIRVGGEPDPSAVAVPLGEVHRILIASPQLFATRRLPQRPADLADLSWLALQPFYRNELRLLGNTGEEHLLAFRPRVVTDSLYALRSSVLLGTGIAAASEWVVKENVAAGRLLRLLPEWQAVPLPVYLVYPYAPFYPARLRAFVDIMRKAMSVLPGKARATG
ncbi:MAG: LysR family transcriptional regulator [Candidatus Dactylopiibacterium carminicum]|nr:MAG: LysR family transcriptional regulator [Candidatus Dactylopiibacterium carminicum]